MMNTQALQRTSIVDASPMRKRGGPHPDRWQGALLVAGMHIAVLAGLWNYQPAREALATAMPIMVSFITPPQPELRREKPKPLAKPVPVPHRIEQQPVPQIISAQVEAPAAQTVPAPEPPKPVTPVAVLAAAPVVIVPPAPPPVIPPRFDAAYLDNPAPAYPAPSRRMREQGKVVLRVLVSAAGAAERVELRASSGAPRLDAAALDTVKHWRFVPAKQGTNAVSAWVLVPISFALEG